MVYEPLYHALQTDGNCTRPLKLKNKLKIGCFYKQSREEFSIFCGRFDKTIIPLALVGCEMIIVNSALHAFVGYPPSHDPTSTRGIFVNFCFVI